MIGEVRAEGRRAMLVRSDGLVALDRTCRSAKEAETFASALRQHQGWLSDERFREYYGLDG